MLRKEKRLTRKQATAMLAELAAAGHDAGIQIMGDNKPTVVIYEPYEGQRCGVKSFAHPSEFAEFMYLAEKHYSPNFPHEFTVCGISTFGRLVTYQNTPANVFARPVSCPACLRFIAAM